MNLETHSVELIEGYTDKKGVKHTEVKFGKRPTVGDLMAIERDPQAQNPTLYEDLIRRLMITAFGSLKCPVMLPVLLELDTIDRDDLGAAANEFLRMTRPEDNGELLPDDAVRLMFGITIESTTYNIFKFGNRLTGKDLLDADKNGLIGVSKNAFEIGRQVSEVSHSETGLTVKGILSLEQMASLDSEDFNLLRVAGELYRQSFRARRKTVSGKQSGENGVSTDARNGDVGGGNSRAAVRKTK